MFKPLSKLLIMLILLVTFVGQTMANHFVTSDNDTSNLQTKISQQPTFVNEHIDSEASKNVDDCCDIECCDGECFCPGNACTSLAYLNNTLILSKLMLLSGAAFLLEQEASQFIASSLYRPPIFTS